MTAPFMAGDASPYAAISLIAPCGPHGAIREIRRYPLCGDTPQRPADVTHQTWPRNTSTTFRSSIALSSGNDGLI